MPTEGSEDQVVGLEAVTAWVQRDQRQREEAARLAQERGNRRRDRRHRDGELAKESPPRQRRRADPDLTRGPQFFKRLLGLRPGQKGGPVAPPTPRRPMPSATDLSDPGAYFVSRHPAGSQDHPGPRHREDPGSAALGERPSPDVDMRFPAAAVAGPTTRTNKEESR